MNETEVRDLIDKAQKTITKTQRMAVNSLSEITAYIIDQKLKINELLNEIVNLECERNDWKQRAEVAEMDYEICDKTIRKETAKEILSYIGNLEDDCDSRFHLKDYQWFKNLCNKYGIKVST